MNFSSKNLTITVFFNAERFYVYIFILHLCGRIVLQRSRWMYLKTISNKYAWMHCIPLLCLCCACLSWFLSGRRQLSAPPFLHTIPLHLCYLPFCLLSLGCLFPISIQMSCTPSNGLLGTVIVLYIPLCKVVSGVDLLRGGRSSNSPHRGDVSETLLPFFILPKLVNCRVLRRKGNIPGHLQCFF